MVSRVRREFFALPPYLTKELRELDDPARGGISGDAALLFAIDLDREHESGDPDGHDHDVDQNGERAADAHGLQEGLHVRDEDDAAYGGAEDAGWHDAH